jgi:phosphatidate cytidylyltransferase
MAAAGGRIARQAVRLVSSLGKRILVGAVGIPLLLFAAFYGGWVLMSVVVLIQAAALWEWTRLCKASNTSPQPVGLAISLAAVDVLVWLNGDPSAIGFGLAALIVAQLMEVFRRERHPLRNLAASWLFVGYIVLPLALWVPISSGGSATTWLALGPLPVLLVATWVCDTAAYVFGSRFGRHKLDTGASPNKTVEGFVAGVIIAALVLPVFRGLDLLRPSGWDYLVVPLIVGLAGQVGDLLESLMKREVKVKDTSGLLPGHGGILDRFDSLFVSSPLLLAYLLISST